MENKYKVTKREDFDDEIDFDVILFLILIISCKEHSALDSDDKGDPFCKATF